MSTRTSEPSTSREAPERVLNRLDWRLLRRLDGILQGDYRSLFMGGGLDFAELREYQPPDDVRHIDWNVTARMDMPFVRRYLEDREVTAWFLVDLSPSMAFGAQERRKESVVVDLVGLLARLAHSQRQPRRRDTLRQRRGARDTAPRRARPGAAADK